MVMRIRCAALCGVSTLLVSAVLLTAVSAQEFRGSITGRVVDSTAAILPGATVSATNAATNVTVTSVTNDAGVYSLLYLLPANYTVSFELPGFKRLVRTVDVRVGDRIALDVTLETGAVEETITVTGESPLLETAS